MAAVSWGRAECARVHQHADGEWEPDRATLREVLRDVLPLVRLPLLTDTQVALQVIPCGWLPPEVASSLPLYAVVRRIDSNAPLPEVLAGFNSTPRRGPTVTWSRPLQSTALTGHTQWVSACSWSPDGKTLDSGSADRSVRLWDVATSQCLATLCGHTDSVEACACSPEGRRLASTSGDYTVRMRDVDTCQCQTTLIRYQAGEQLCVVARRQNACVCFVRPNGNLEACVVSPHRTGH